MKLTDYEIRRFLQGLGKEEQRKLKKQEKDKVRRKERNRKKYQKAYHKKRNTPEYKALRKEYSNSEKYKLSHRKHTLKKSYGITFEEYNKMFVNQFGCCKICGRHQEHLKRALSVDHCHKSGRIRGLLCHKCNLMLGLVGDNIETLSKAMKYLSIL